MYNRYKYDGHSNPWVWSEPKKKVFETFEDMVQAWIKESKERCRGLKTEFISNNEIDKLAIKKSKYLKSKNKKMDRGD